MAKFALKGHEQTLFRHFPVVLIYAEATFEKLQITLDYQIGY